MKTVKWKVALVPVLAIILAWSLLRSSAENLPAVVQKSKLPESPNVGAKEVTMTASITARVAPPFDIVTARNLFAPIAQNAESVAATAAPAAAKNEKLSEMRTDTINVHAIVTTGGRYHAMIDGRWIKTGETVNGDRQVLAISRDHLLIKRSRMGEGSHNSMQNR